jgi:phosphotransferase system HPr (HPr) family protein
LTFSVRALSQAGLQAMTGESLRQAILITNPQGLHMRPITAFVEAATRFQSNIQLGKSGGELVNGKSPIALLGLGAEHGTELILEVAGPDAADAMKALVEVLKRSSFEEE